ncbi:alpha/beta fold hydrolase [Mesorhizobium sp.]|uniref:alpha/beta fold hydrolase n=1 Tax=Mesorhizobium sp. TaxID=1871066 RepID=UPI000FE4D113|nr:alpha/beta hydrolase [Mesorhizobium sp.]RWB58048.1 MAG: alpha/beta hydrolase [Mesorhizobium sp.]TKB21902.1 MAG: alpha/beta hydrolase [Mesorhizobium sp.]
MFEGFARKAFTIDGIDIACEVGGSGPPVLLLHGFPQCRAMWARVAPLLADRFTVVCADLRGYGDSSKPKCLPDRSNYSFRAMANDQVGLMRQLGFDRFHVVGHDRGGRTGHRMALDHPEAVLSLTVMDIVPTYAMFTDTNRHVAGAYWHWYFLSQPEPLPERLIGNDPDFFYETCLVGWGATSISSFDPEMIAEYRRAWHDPGMIHGSCSDYRAAASIDLEHDAADIGRKVLCPTLVFYGSSGTMASLFNIPAEWRKRAADMTEASLPGGHFFVDQFPAETAERIIAFLSGHS